MTTNAPTPVLAVLGRVFWMLFGPMLLLVLTFLIIQVGSGWLTTADVAFLAVLGGMLLGRWLEFHFGESRTADGEPATPGHLRRYLVAAVVVGLAVWAAANVIGNYLLPR